MPACHPCHPCNMNHGTCHRKFRVRLRIYGFKWPFGHNTTHRSHSHDLDACTWHENGRFGHRAKNNGQNEYGQRFGQIIGVAVHCDKLYGGYECEHLHGDFIGTEPMRCLGMFYQFSTCVQFDSQCDFDAIAWIANGTAE